MKSPSVGLNLETSLRIISNGTHDYYDVIQRYDEDRELIYDRRAIEEKLEIPYDPRNPICNHLEYYNIGVSIIKYVVGFCGKIYPMVWISRRDNPQVFCYKIEDVDTFIKGNFDKEDQERYFEKPRQGRHWKKGYESGTRTLFQNYLNYDFPEYQKYFLKYKAPIFYTQQKYQSTREYTLIINGCLSDIGFFRIFDVNSAYQEISMFVGGALASPPKEPPKISDEILASIKGFDRYSFRKDKATKSPV